MHKLMYLPLFIIFGFILSCGGANEIKIGAIFAETGPASFLGTPEAKTARMLEEQINISGGIKGKKIKIIIKDSQGNPEKAISFAKQLIEEEKVIAIIGPTTSGESLKIKSICEQAKTPLISCAAAEQIVVPVSKYVFKTPQNDSIVVKWIYKTMNDIGITNIAVIAANTGFGNAGKEQLIKYAPEYKINIVIAESYDKDSTDLTALLTKIKAIQKPKVQAIVNWSIEPAQSIVAKNLKQLKFDVPLFQSHGFGNIKYVEAAGEAAEGIIFPCGRLLIADLLPDTHPQKQVLVKYKNDYESLYKENVSTFGGHAYDAIALLIEAIKIADSFDKDKIRDALEKIKNFPGTGGIFTMSETDHNGLGMDAVEMLTVKNGKFVPLGIIK